MKKLLSTKTLDESDIAYAQTLGMKIHCVDFIETQAIEFTTEPVQQRNFDALVFTSANGVKYFFENNSAASPSLPERGLGGEASLRQFDLHPTTVAGKKIFSIGYKTADALSDYNIRITTAADNASELADEIIQSQLSKSVLHICGDKALDILKVKLGHAGIEYEQLVVYKTVLLKPELTDHNFDAIIFFSPSGVESFFASNTLHANTLCCCIGSTTADALKKASAGAEMVIADEPEVEAMIEGLAKYFSKNENVNSSK